MGTQQEFVRVRHVHTHRNTSRIFSVDGFAGHDEGEGLVHGHHRAQSPAVNSAVLSHVLTGTFS